MLLTPLVVILICISLGHSQSTNSGFEVELTNVGLDYIRQVGIPIIQKEIQTMTIPDINGEASTPIGKVEYSVTHMKTSSVNLGTTVIASSTHGIVLGINDASVALSGDWSYKEKSFPHISDHGTFDASASGVSANIVIATGITPNFEPEVKVASCSGGISKIDVKFHGGASWLYNLFDGFIADALKKSLNKELCDEISNEINVQVNKVLAKLPTEEPLDKYAGLNFQLVAAPATTATYVAIASKGQFYVLSEPAAVPPLPQPSIPNPTQFARMFYFYLTPYTLESAGWAYATAGVLNYTVFPNMVPPSFPIQLNTNSIGTLIPALKRLYPNEPMDLFLSPGPVPVDVTTTPAGVNVTLYVMMTFVVAPADLPETYVFTLNSTVHTAAQIWVAQVNNSEVVAANLTFLTLDLSVYNTTIGPIDVGPINAIVNTFVNLFLLPGLNKHLEKGFPLPIVDGMSFVNPAIVFQQSFLAIATDVVYKPTVVVM